MDELPQSLVARAQAWLRGEVEAVAPRDAATVVLLRDGRLGLEAYLLRRARSMAFAAGMHAFPGGSTDPRDGERGPAWAGRPVADWAAVLHCDEVLARSLVCAAVRETFEEAGVLLAGPSADTVVAETTPDDWERDRRRLLDRSRSLSELLQQRRLLLRSDLLTPWAHWITPEFEPRRFDTRFFVAAVPEGQRARDLSGEADQAVWMPVAEAVKGFEAARLPMLPPTIVVLRELTTFDTVAAALAAEVSITPLMPRPALTPDGVLLVVDGPDGERAAHTAVRVRA